jgi:hypothetical protein
MAGIRALARTSESCSSETVSRSTSGGMIASSASSVSPSPIRCAIV